jgi:hypothetical protein
LVHALSLVPFRDVWDAVGEAALSISQHAKLIQSLKWGGVPPWCDKREIEMVALQDGEQNPYFYVVNTDAVETVNFRLMNLDPENKVEDLYARQVLDIYPERVELHHGVRMDTGVLRLTLRPGEGKLLRYLAAKPTTGLRVKYPEWVEKTPEGKCQYLIDLRAENVPQPDWLPAKKGWGELNGDTKLYTSKRDAGRDYKKALYAHAETEIVYTVPDGYTHFVAAAGFGDPGVPRGSVVFRVLVDGKERFRSESYTLSPVLPIVVDVKGAKRLELVTEDAGDGIYHDYVWWAEARLIRE